MICQFGVNLSTFEFFSLPKCSSGHVKYSFDSPAEKVSQSPKIFRSKSKFINSYFKKKSKKMLLPKCSSGHVECSFGNFPQKFKPKSEKNSKVLEFFRKSLTLFFLTRRNDSLECHFLSTIVLTEIKAGFLAHSAPQSAYIFMKFPTFSLLSLLWLTFAALPLFLFNKLFSS